MKKVDEKNHEVFVHESTGAKVWIDKDKSNSEKREILEAAEHFIDYVFGSNRDRRMDN